MKHLISIIVSILILTGALVANFGTLVGNDQATDVTTLGTGSTSSSVAGAGVTPGAKLDGLPAVSVLNTLPVKGKAPATGYDRNQKFGNGWKDFNGNKCDERQDTLKRDLSSVKFKDAKKCQLASGTLADVYTGTTIKWKVNSGSVDIDHVVALKNAWVSGGMQLSQDQRQGLANDPLNLMASQASANRSKGDANAAEWLPANKSFRCRYVATQISVKKKYTLSVTASEKNAMERVLSTCPKQKAASVTPLKPLAKVPTVAPGTNAAPAKKPSTTAPKPKHVSPGAYCAQADKDTKGIGKKTGKSYTCKSSDSDTRLRWR
ncbi:HNH endonuclease family protein [Paeniglutamicibacter sp. ORCA_105]|uniref:HNH endonuclease family protein n=1 Tax=Paeniglutamicibacter sp. ORCA_105 TaxID=3377336 RepID=UPI003894508D